MTGYPYHAVAIAVLICTLAFERIALLVWRITVQTVWLSVEEAQLRFLADFRHRHGGGA